MASNSQLTQEIMDDIEKSSVQVRKKVQRLVGDITVDILSQNESRFTRLGKNYTLTYTSSDTAQRVPSDFASARPVSLIVNSDDEFVAEIEVVTENAFFQRKGDVNYTGSIYAYIENRTGDQGPGEYLVLNASPSATLYIKFMYYREPLRTDTDIITNTMAVKEGVKGSLTRDTYPDSEKSMAIYLRMKPGIKESPTARSTHMAISPNPPTKRLNQRMHDIGRGN
jgi:hypothetical protein